MGQNAGWKKRLVVQWVILQAENFRYDARCKDAVLIFAVQSEAWRSSAGEQLREE